MMVVCDLGHFYSLMDLLDRRSVEEPENAIVLLLRMS
jgi:hypothetical protein